MRAHACENGSSAWARCKYGSRQSALRYFPLEHIVFSDPFASQKCPRILGGKEGFKPPTTNENEFFCACSRVRKRLLGFVGTPLIISLPRLCEAKRAEHG